MAVVDDVVELAPHDVPFLCEAHHAQEGGVAERRHPLVVHRVEALHHGVEQQAGVGLAALQALRRQLLLGAVAEHLHEAHRLAGIVAEHRHLAAGPEAGAVLALVPALVVAHPGLQRQRHLHLRATGGDILGREDAVDGLAQHLRLGPAEHAARALIPGGDAGVPVGCDDGEVGGAVDDPPVDSSVRHVEPAMLRRHVSPHETPALGVHASLRASRAP